ncbi:MAG: terminase small subunit [Saprospiraceae bacterium]
MTKEQELHEQYGINESDLNFIHKYIEHNFNGKKAWKELHPACKDNAAMTQASMTLRKPKVKAAYRAELRHYIDVTGMQAFHVVKELVSIANSDITDYVDEKGGEIILKSLDDIKINSKPIREITLTPMSVESIGEEDDNGRPIYRQANKVNIKLHDKLRALQMIGDNLGVFEKQQISDTDEIEYDIVERLYGED